MKLAVALGFLGLNIYTYHYLATDEVYPPRAQFENFPLEVDEWGCAGREKIGDNIVRALDVTDYLQCTYRRVAPRETVAFYAGYHQTQVRTEGGAASTAIHPPKHCLPGSGWDIIAAEVVPLEIPDWQDGSANVNRLVIAKGETRALVYYWYQSGRSPPSRTWLTCWSQSSRTTCPTEYGRVSGLYSRLPVFAQNLACTGAGWARARDRYTPYFRKSLSAWERTGNGPALASIPPLDKETYRARAEDFVARDIPRRRLRRSKTSGTTGTALPLWYTRETLAEEYATVWRLRRQSGVGLRDPHISFGGQIIVPFSQSAPPFWRTNAYAGQTLFSLYHMSPQNLPAYLDAIHRSPARYAQGYPSSMHLLGRAMLEAGRPLPRGRLAAVFTSSESLLAFQREIIEQAFAAPVRDRYGTSEFAVSMTGCPENRLHVDMEFCIVEVEPLEETDEWVRGPLLVTGLGNDACAFLRYRIGDVGTRLKSPCPCGRPGDVFADVDGRIEDYVVTPDGRRIGRLDHIFKEQLDVAEAQILQETQKAIEVLVVARPGWTESSARGLLKEFRSRLGDEIDVALRLVDAIPREANGKFRAVKSKVGGIDA
jgi:phenylacetate-CoA ligase